MVVVSRLAAVMRRFANWRLIAFTGVVFAAFAGLLFGSTASFSIGHVQALCGQAPPDVRFFTSAAELQGFMSGCGEAGLTAYRHLQVADLFHPAVSALFMSSALAMALSRTVRPGSYWLAAAALPLFGAGFDYLENIAMWIALRSYPEASGAGATLLGGASAAKQTVNWAAGLILLIVGAYAVARIAMKRRRKSVAMPEH
jgi:hypothetical protein